MNVTQCGLPSSQCNASGNDTEYGGGTNGFHQIEQVTFLCVLFALIVVGNVSVLVAILLSKNRKSRMNFFIMQLAIADLATGFIIVLPDIIWKITVGWYAGAVMCKILKFLQSTVLYGSTYVLVALSIDRLDAIARPMSFSGSGLRARVLILVAWFLAVLLSIHMLVLSDMAMDSGLYQCWTNLLEDWHWKPYVTVHCIMIFLMPTIVIACCYGIIVRIIWSKASPHMEPRQIRRFGRGTKRTQPLVNGEVHSGNDTCKSLTSSSSSRGVIPKARIKTIKMTCVIVLVFLVCWSPYFIYNLLFVYNQIPDTPETRAITIFINSLCPLNSAANPIIYCLFSTKLCNNWRRVHCIDRLLKFLNCCQPKEVERTEMTSDYTLVESSRAVGHSGHGQDQHSPLQLTKKTNPNGKQRKPSSPLTGGICSSSAGSGEGGNARRASSTPFIRSKLSEKENDILMKHLPAAGNGSSCCDKKQGN